MTRMIRKLWAVSATGLAALVVACGGGGGGGGEETVAASATQAAQAVLVATAAIDAADTATDTGTEVVTASSTAQVEAAAMDMGGVTPSTHVHFAGMGGGPGMLDVNGTSCDQSGTVDVHMQWSDLDPDTPCADGLTTTLDFDDCASVAGQSMLGRMTLAVSGSTCDPQALNMDFSRVTLEGPEGLLSGDFTMEMSGMMFVGHPAELDIAEGTITFDGRMLMAGTSFGNLDMEMDRLAFHFDDQDGTGDLNGSMIVRCNGQAFPMTMTTDADGLILDDQGLVVGGHMEVVSGTHAFQATFNPDHSVDVTGGDGPVHLAEPLDGDFCTL